MIKEKNKTKISTIALVLILTITATLITGLPFVNAQETMKTTFIYAAAAPNPIGVGQTTLVVWWIDIVPPTNNLLGGSWSDFNRWHDISVEITKPDQSKQTMGPYTSDPVGGSWFTYTPDQVGDYTFQAIWPGELKTTTLTEAWSRTSPIQGPGDYWWPGCTSELATLTVQQEPLTELPPAELPTGYWTRPIDSANREWWQIAGNWLNDGRDNRYTTGPKTAHIVWTKPQTIGGLTGGEFGTIGYYDGSSYERKWRPTAIIQGMLYYKVGRSDQPQTRGTMCVDLRTGEEIWFANDTTLDMGVIYNYESPNQHGTIPYLVDTGGTTRFYDPFTGEWLYTIENVPSGTAAVGPNGERLIYKFDFAAGWMSLWNSTGIQALAGAETGTSGWQWRPVGKTVNGNDGWEWNVTIPDLSLPGAEATAGPAISAVLDDRIIGTTGLRSFQYGTLAYSVWCLSLKPGQEGTLMWKKEYTEPPILGGTMVMVTRDLDSKVFVMRAKETRQLYGYDLDTGNLLWGPTESFASWAMYGMSSVIRDGVLYVSTNYDGQIFAFDAKTGTKLWEWTGYTCGLEGPYERWPLSGSPLVIDGKIYIRTGEHSHTQPLYRGWSIYCIDAESGAGLWNITGVWNTQILADGYMVSLNGMDNQIYCFGKGQTATTVLVQNDVISKGNSVMIKGTVTDQSPGAKGTPAIADTDMTEWMEYIYKQHAMPMDASGVPVTIDAIDPNGNFINIGKVTSDASGMFKKMWEPEHEGEYTIIATFEGSDAYFSSYAENAIGVGPASSPGTPIEPEPATEAPLITTELAIIAAIAVIAAIGIVAFWALKKRK